MTTNQSKDAVRNRQIFEFVRGELPRIRRLGSLLSRSVSRAKMSATAAPLAHAFFLSARFVPFVGALEWPNSS
ncbi:MAG: hypothetical protein LBF26_03350 [Puniceicoccales bacterium]|nr:hypothetical protein [Puniceicoccales bacterium]